MANLGFVGALRSHAREVAGLEDQQAAEFLRLLQETRERVTGRLAIEFGEDEATLDAMRLRRVLAETETGIAVLKSKAARFYGTAQSEAIDMAIAHLGDEIGVLSKAFDGERLTVSIEAPAVWADPAHQLLANHFESSVATYGNDLLNDVRRRLFMGLRTGTPTRQIVREVSGLDGPMGTIGRSNAERLVRTEVSEAFGVAKDDSLAESAALVPGLRPMWMHVGSYICKTCIRLHGTFRPEVGYWTIVTGKKEKRVRRVAHPPAHPR